MALVPDVPLDVQVQIHRENQYEQKLLFEDDTNTEGPHQQRISVASDQDVLPQKISYHISTTHKCPQCDIMAEIPAMDTNLSCGDTLPANQAESTTVAVKL